MNELNPALESQIKKAATLMEALPYLQQFRGQTIVVKLGGSAMEDDELVRKVMRDLVFLEAVGVNPVVVHGGGKFISAAMQEAGLEPKFVNGLRFTCEKSIKIVDQTLNERINPSLVEKAIKHGGQAVGIRGQNVFIAESEPDLGHVGQVPTVDLAPVEAVLNDERIPVLSPLAANAAGGEFPLNVNADLAASALARKLKATKLVYLSDVLGVMGDPKDLSTLISTIDEVKADSLIADKVIQGGMIPKVQSSLDALHDGVGKVHLIDGRIPHSLLLEMFTDYGIGTQIVPSTLRGNTMSDSG